MYNYNEPKEEILGAFRARAFASVLLTASIGFGAAAKLLEEATAALYCCSQHPRRRRIDRLRSAGISGPLVRHHCGRAQPAPKSRLAAGIAAPRTPSLATTQER